MKKILFSVMAILLAVGLVGGGAFAYFFDVETSENNVFTAGTIDLSAPIVEAVKMEDLKPCETGYLVFVVHNDGNNEMDVWKHLYNVGCAEGDLPEPEEEYYEDNGIASPPGKNDIDTVIVYDLMVGVCEEPCLMALGECMDACMAAGLDIEECFMECSTVPCCTFEPIIFPPEEPTISDIESHYIYLGELEPCEWMLIVQSYHMEADTENWAQGDTMTFDVEFYAEQLNGAGPPGPIWP